MSAASPKPASTGSSGESSLLLRWALGGIAACCGEAVTFPLDFTKVREHTARAVGEIRMLQLSTCCTQCAARGFNPLTLPSSFTFRCRSPDAIATPGGSLDVCAVVAPLGHETHFAASNAATRSTAFNSTHPPTPTLHPPQNELGKTLGGEAAAGKGRGMLATAVHIFRTEGLLAMYGGLGAAALRQFVYGGIGVGLYVPMRTLVIGADTDAKTAPLWKRMLAGALSGSVGQIVANPADVVKVRLQADGRLKAIGQAPRYKGTLDAFARIPAEEGVKGFFKGLVPSVQVREGGGVDGAGGEWEMAHHTQGECTYVARHGRA